MSGITKAERWPQPICVRCWYKQNPDRDPVKVLPHEWERCCMCGVQTLSGIYVRENPSEVPYPTMTADE